MSFFKKKPSQQANTMQEDSCTALFPSLDENITFIREAFFHTDDLKMRNVIWEDKPGTVIYLDTMVDTVQFQTSFLVPLKDAQEGQHVLELIASPEIDKTNKLNTVVSGLIKGNCALFLEDGTTSILFNCMQTNDRSPDEPDNEKTVRGSHKGFIENLQVNLNLIRERIHNPQLTFKYFQLGTDTKTDLAIIYMNGIADPKKVDMVQKRIESMTTDMTFTPGFIEEGMEDTAYSPFPQVLFTERPDRIEANLIEGRIVILNDGSSDAAIVPVTFFSFFQTPDDYNLRFYTGSFFRFLRLCCFLGAILFPSLYIAVIAFHFEIIPFQMLSVVKSATENIPFPPLIEALIMLITIELIREAGIRLPTPIGQTIGIVGGLIIGEAVVNAGFISNTMVIVIALTAIMSFCIPSYEMGNTIRLLSIPFMFGAATLGFVGITFAMLILIIHLCTLQSLGTAYLSPLTPFHAIELKDAFIRAPNWMMKHRPQGIHPQKPLRQRDLREWDKHDE